MTSNFFFLDTKIINIIIIILVSLFDYYIISYGQLKMRINYNTLYINFIHF